MTEEAIKLEVLKVLLNYKQFEEARANHGITIKETDRDGWVFLVELQSSETCPFFPYRANSVEKNLDSRRHKYLNQEFIEHRAPHKSSKLRYYKKRPVRGSARRWESDPRIPESPKDVKSTKAYWKDLGKNKDGSEIVVQKSTRDKEDSERTIYDGFDSGYGYVTAYRIKNGKNVFRQLLAHMYKNECFDDFYNSDYCQDFMPYYRELAGRFYGLIAPRGKWRLKTKNEIRQYHDAAMIFMRLFTKQFCEFVAGNKRVATDLVEIRDALGTTLGGDNDTTLWFVGRLNNHFDWTAKKSRLAELMRPDTHYKRTMSLRSSTLVFLKSLAKKYDDSPKLRAEIARLEELVKRYEESQIVWL